MNETKFNGEYRLCQSCGVVLFMSDEGERDCGLCQWPPKPKKKKPRKPARRRARGGGK